METLGCLHDKLVFSLWHSSILLPSLFHVWLTGLSVCLLHSSQIPWEIEDSLYCSSDHVCVCDWDCVFCHMTAQWYLEECKQHTRMAKYTHSDSLSCLLSLASKEWSMWVHILRVDLSSKWYVCWNELWFMKDCVVQWDSESRLQTVNANWIIMTLLLPPDISSVKAPRTTAISHADFLMRPSLCEVYWCHLWHEQSWCGHIKLAMMSAWKHLSAWLIYQTEVKYLAHGHLVSCLHRASISYLIQIMEDTLLHSNKVACHREQQALCSICSLWVSDVQK